jgi:hypothetical protein
MFQKNRSSALSQRGFLLSSTLSLAQRCSVCVTSCLIVHRHRHSIQRAVYRLIRRARQSHPAKTFLNTAYRGAVCRSISYFCLISHVRYNMYIMSSLCLVRVGEVEDVCGEGGVQQLQVTVLIRLEHKHTDKGYSHTKHTCKAHSHTHTKHTHIVSYKHTYTYSHTKRGRGIETERKGRTTLARQHNSYVYEFIYISNVGMGFGVLTPTCFSSRSEMPDLINGMMAALVTCTCQYKRELSTCDRPITCIWMLSGYRGAKSRSTDRGL